MKKPPSPPVCRIRSCPRAGKPFETRAALGSHRRRVHGLRAISTKIKRPPGGTFYCDVEVLRPVRCDAAPYVTRGGLGLHKAREHGIRSIQVDAVKKRQWRAAGRADAAGTPPRERDARDAIADSFGKPAATRDPLPAIPGVTPPSRPRAPLDPGQRRALAKRVLWLLQVEWARGLCGGAHPLDVRDALAEIIVTNFAVLSPTRSAATDALTIALSAERTRS